MRRRVELATAAQCQCEYLHQHEQGYGRVLQCRDAGRPIYNAAMQNNAVEGHCRVTLLTSRPALHSGRLDVDALSSTPRRIQRHLADLAVVKRLSIKLPCRRCLRRKTEEERD